MSKAIVSGLLLVLFTTTATSAPAKPASCTTKEYRQFDFWLGDCSVKDDKGKLLGHNKIKAILNGCALSESWTSAAGNPGNSYNFYDKATKQWHQTWIDAQDDALYLNGKLTNGKMVLQGKTPDSKGVITLQRIS
jgi:hypothetical protein